MRRKSPISDFAGSRAVTVSFVRVVGCDRCRFAGVYGLGCFDWGGYLLGGKQYWAVHFMTCVRCGLAHCFGQDHFETEPSDLYAQGGRLFLVAEIVEYLDHRGECFEEERDFLKLSEWVPCHQDLARRRPQLREERRTPVLPGIRLQRLPSTRDSPDSPGA